MKPLLLTNALIISEDMRYQADILIDKGRIQKIASFIPSRPEGYRKYKPPFCSSSEVSYLKFPHSFTAQAPILTAGPA